MEKCHHNQNPASCTFCVAKRDILALEDKRILDAIDEKLGDNMPGPVSQSYDPEPDLRVNWRNHVELQGLRYLVLKFEDLFEIATEQELQMLNKLLADNEKSRKAQGKPPANKYWVVNRDEPFAPKVKQMMEDYHGIQIQD
jgi:hypothetical protein